MSDQKDQAPNSPSQSTGLPIKKRDFTETMLSYNSTNDDILFSRMNKDKKLSMLQEKAYFYALQAFSAASPEISRPRIMIVKELMKELNIKHKTHIDIEDAIKADPMVQRLRNVSLASDDKEMQKLTVPEERTITTTFTGVDGQPLTICMKPNEDGMLEIRHIILSPAKIQDESPIPSWGRVPHVPRWGHVFED